MFASDKGSKTRMRMYHANNILFHSDKDDDNRNKKIPTYDMRDGSSKFQLRKELDDEIDKMWMLMRNIHKRRYD